MGICISKPPTATVFIPVQGGNLLEATIVNPTADEKWFAGKQKEDLKAALGKKSVARIKPDIRQIKSRPAFNALNLSEQLRNGPPPLELIREDRLSTQPRNLQVVTHLETVGVAKCFRSLN